MVRGQELASTTLYNPLITEVFHLTERRENNFYSCYTEVLVTERCRERQRRSSAGGLAFARKVCVDKGLLRPRLPGACGSWSWAQAHALPPPLLVWEAGSWLQCLTEDEPDA